MMTDEAREFAEAMRNGDASTVAMIVSDRLVECGLIECRHQGRFWSLLFTNLVTRGGFEDVAVMPAARSSRRDPRRPILN